MEINKEQKEELEKVYESILIEEESGHHKNEREFFAIKLFIDAIEENSIDDFINTYIKE